MKNTWHQGCLFCSLFICAIEDTFLFFLNILLFGLFNGYQNIITFFLSFTLILPCWLSAHLILPPSSYHSVTKSCRSKGSETCALNHNDINQFLQINVHLKTKILPHKLGRAEPLTLSSCAPCWHRGNVLNFGSKRLSAVLHAMWWLLPKIGWVLLTKIKLSSWLSWWCCKNARGCCEVFYK